MVQLIINSRPHSVTKFTPFFATSVDPRKPPSHALDELSSCPMELSTDFCANITNKTALLKRCGKKQRTIKTSQLVRKTLMVFPLSLTFPKELFNETPERLHGKWLGPFRVIESHTDSSRINLLNLVTKNTGYSSSHLCNKLISSSANPQ
ncbi:hypothetical protein GEMRC1_014067 [Eukaryota sp. GEM-RC1]